MFYTYILKSKKDNRRYIGYTNDIEVRLKFHNTGLNPSTKNRRPLELLCFKEFNNKEEALRYERYLKKLKGGKQLILEIEKMLLNADVAQLVEQLHGRPKRSCPLAEKSASESRITVKSQILAKTVAMSNH